MMRNWYNLYALSDSKSFSFRMIDVDGSGHIGYPEFEMVIQTTQRILGFVDEY